MAHLAVAGIIGQASALRLATASVVPVPQSISVDIVSSPDEALKPQPKPQPMQMVEVPTQAAKPIPTYTQSVPHQVQSSPKPQSSNTNPRPVNPQATSTPGGEVNHGSTSARGDLQGEWGGGKTPTGWVPNNSGGEGRGSGTSAGQGTPEPPKPVVEPPVVKPTPPPAPTPRMVQARVCDESGHLAGEHCKRTHTGSFIDGQQPTRKCMQCKAPEPEPVHHSRLADRANPELIRDSQPSVPASVDEGLSVSVEVEYTVTADGEVSGVKVTRSSGNRALDKAVVSATSGLRYRPAVQDGVARSVKMTRTYKIKT